MAFHHSSRQFGIEYLQLKNASLSLRLSALPRGRDAGHLSAVAKCPIRFATASLTAKKLNSASFLIATGLHIRRQAGNPYPTIGRIESYLKDSKSSRQAWYLQDDTRGFQDAS